PGACGSGDGLATFRVRLASHGLEGDDQAGALPRGQRGIAACLEGQDHRQGGSRMRAAWFAGIAVWVVFSSAAHAIEVDGRIDTLEWQGALQVTDFRKVQPLSGEPASQPTQAWV